MKKPKSNHSKARAGIPCPAIQTFQAFCIAAGVARITGYRMRKKRWIETVNIAGRPYVTAEAIEKFKKRAESGEFAQEHFVPTR